MNITRARLGTVIHNTSNELLEKAAYISPQYNRFVVCVYGTEVCMFHYTTRFKVFTTYNTRVPITETLWGDVE